MPSFPQKMLPEKTPVSTINLLTKQDHVFLD